VAGRAPNGLLIPPRFSFERLLDSPRIAPQRKLLLLPGAESQDYAEQIDDILALLAGTYRSAEGVQAHVVPGVGAEVAGARGLRFAANCHVSPATVLEAVDGYRAFFQPSDFLDKTYVSVSADVAVAEDDARARELATGYAAWSAASAPPRSNSTRATPWPCTPTDSSKRVARTSAEASKPSVLNFSAAPPAPWRTKLTASSRTCCLL
jgi:alkanesulfonate monooxygenase SsuD/methylene tetrahydromethanopterin reductase-like flavin-dependent oxidoreductase (luciferase family)